MPPTSALDQQPKGLDESHRDTPRKQVLHTTQVTKDNAGQVYKQYDMSARSAADAGSRRISTREGPS